MSTLRVNAIVDASGGDTSTINSGTPVSTTSTQVAKAWVNFNGTGTVAIRQSYNVSSITDLGVGSYVVTFSTALVDADYAVGAASSGTTSTQVGNINVGMREDGRLNTSCQLAIYSTSNTANDTLAVTAAFFR